MTQEYNLVATRSNSKPKVFDTIAEVCKALQDFGAILSIGWQKIESGLICRYLVASLEPRLVIDVIHFDSEKIFLSLSNADQWCVKHDDIMPQYAHVLAAEICFATLGGKGVTFKQQALRQSAGGVRHG